MEKTIEIIIAAAVFVLVGSVLSFMISGQSGDFMDFVGNESEGAQCGLWETQYKNQGCPSSGDLKSKLEDICGGAPSCS